MAKIDVLRINNGTRKNLDDLVTEEVPLTIHLNGKELLTLLCSPRDLKELSIGFLYSNGLIQSLEEIENIIIDAQYWNSHIELKTKNEATQLLFKRLYTSGCGRGTIFYNALEPIRKRKIAGRSKISSEKIIKLINSFQKMSLVFRETGGVHSAALANSDSILAFKEDIGRHNAIDKIIGEALLRGIDTKNLIILSSGRISSEILSKVERIRAAFLVSRSAPTDQAIKRARELNLTLIGFVRSRRMNVYTAEERVA
ncbi:formate dehydrogenase accessory sulfurtransferase FdhD [Candidatus Omnitrophota bacterium]